jgi:hypothetical protein
MKEEGTQPLQPSWDVLSPVHMGRSRLSPAGNLPGTCLATVAIWARR